MRADDVRRDMRCQKRKREAVYDSVLSFIHGAILKRAEVGGVRMVYDVPLIVVGKPIVKLGDCVRHVLNSLQGDGYTVRLKLPKSVYISWDLEEKRRAPKLSESEIETLSGSVEAFFSRKQTAPKSDNVSRSKHQSCHGGGAVQIVAPPPPPPQLGSGPVANPAPQTQSAMPAYRNPPATRLPERALPWEAFERRAQLSLLPPPQMTVTNVCEIARTPRSHDTFYARDESAARAPVLPSPPALQTRPPAEPLRGLSVAKVGPNGGLVLNL